MAVTTVRGGQLRDDTIQEPKLNVSNSPSQNQALTWTGSVLAWAEVGASKSVTQATHGFSVGDLLRMSGTTYIKAQANNSTNAEVVGIVSTVVDVDNFILTTNGAVSGLAGLTAGSVYFLSDSTAGAMTTTEPTTATYISKPVLISDTTTSGFFYNFRGIEIPADTTVLTDTSYVVGELVNESPDDSTTSFTVDNDITDDTESVYLNGVRLLRGGANDYQVNGSTASQIDFASAPYAGDIITVDYLIAS